MSQSPMVNSFDPAGLGGLSTAEAAMIARRQKLLGPGYRLFYQHPVHVVRAEGVWLYGPDGTRYLDAYNNVPVIGHCHPAVVEALARQAARLNTHTRYLDESILDYAEALLATFPSELDQVMFTCTGSEANDLALRVAKVATGGTGFIVTANAYHGVTDAVSLLSPSLGAAVAPGPNVFSIAAPDPRSAGDQDLGVWFGAQVEEALGRMRQQNIRPAALIVDTIFSSDGVFAEPAGFLAPAAARIRRAGGLFIADEVQAGFGRTGDGLWGFQRHGLVPDLVTLGKPMGNGHPIAAMVARSELLRDFGARSRYFNTFGGNTVSIAVAQTVLDVILRERLTEQAQAVGTYFRSELAGRARHEGRLGDVRGSGLFIGVEVVTPEEGRVPDPIAASQIVNALRERSVLISASGPAGHVLKIRPPLPFGRAEVDIFLDAFDAVLRGD